MTLKPSILLQRRQYRDTKLGPKWLHCPHYRLKNTACDRTTRLIKLNKHEYRCPLCNANVHMD